MLFQRRAKPESVTPAPVDADRQRLQQLNLDFLKLLQLTPADTPTLPSLDAAHMGLLQPLCHQSLASMANCDFALFDLGLYRIETWQSRVQSVKTADPLRRYAAATPSTDADETIRSLREAWQGFAADVLLFAWHLAQQPHNARLLLGMREEVATLLQQLEPWQCRQTVQGHPQVLAARWRDNPYFWPDLLRYGCSGEQRYRQFALLLGAQLIAKDLEPSAIMRCSATLAE